MSSSRAEQTACRTVLTEARVSVCESAVRTGPHTFESVVVVEVAASTSAVGCAVVSSAHASNTVAAAELAHVTESQTDELAVGTGGVTGGLVGPLVVAVGGVGSVAAVALFEGLTETCLAAVSAEMAGVVGGLLVKASWAVHYADFVVQIDVVACVHQAGQTLPGVVLAGLAVGAADSAELRGRVGVLAVRTRFHAGGFAILEEVSRAIVSSTSLAVSTRRACALAAGFIANKTFIVADFAIITIRALGKA